MIRKLSEVFSWFRNFTWILEFILLCLNIPFCFTDVICWTGTDTFIDFTSRVQIFIFQTKQTSDFLNGPFNCNIKFVVDKDCNLPKNLFTVFSLLIQYRISTKITFLGSANKKSEIISSYSACLSINFWWNWWMTLPTNLAGKTADDIFL